MIFNRAIVRPPAANFAQGLTTSLLGPPDYDLALEQHEAYCTALQDCGLALTTLEPDPDYPDSTFVEDAAVLTQHCYVLARPGAPARAGEITTMRKVFAEFSGAQLETVDAPGTLDGGDVCEAGKHLFIGISERTNEMGARQMADKLAPFGYTSSFVNIRSTSGLLHLKSGLAYLGENRLVVTETLANREEFAGYELIRVDSGEEYAANCIRVNDRVLVAIGFPKFEAKLKLLGYRTTTLGMSEFQKMDGGLSCLSLRF